MYIGKKIFLLLAVGIINLLWIEKSMALELLSPAFKYGETIPKVYSCDGKELSPPLAWKDVPVGTKSLVLIMEDPDAPAGTWDHWIIYNLPITPSILEEGLQTPPQGALMGKNSWDKTTYGGPCPPDREHRYLFKLYAIDILLPNRVGMTKKEVENEMNGHVIASTELVAKYQRQK